MATYDTLEKSLQDSRPIELYEFTLGSTIFRYTSAEDDLTVGADTFTAEAIARSQVEQGSDAANRTLTVTVPTTNAFAAQYIDVVPGVRASINVFRYQRDESPSFGTQVLLFKGIIQAVQFTDDGTAAEIAVRSIETALNRNIPRFTYMGMCNHFLYSAGCGADPSAHNFVGPVSAVNGNDITLDGAGASGHDFVGGYCHMTGDNDYRMILAQTGDVLTLLLPFGTSPLGSNVQAFAGCDHLVDSDCALVFDRVADFGGFPFVPNINPFQSGLQ